MNSATVSDSTLTIKQQGGIIMIFMEDIIARNVEDIINKDIEDKKEFGFHVMVFHGEMTIKSNIHPWRNNHKGIMMQETAIKKLQKKIGGRFTKNVFKHSELKFDASHIKSARCNKNPKIFAFADNIEIHCTEAKEKGTIIVPKALEKRFKEEFPSIPIETTDERWKFIEFDGSYPSMCSGDTIFTVGDIIVKTKIINTKHLKWSVTIPKWLKREEIDNIDELIDWDNSEFRCCGGCD